MEEMEGRKREEEKKEGVETVKKRKIRKSLGETVGG